MTLPNFLVIGASKCGTDALCNFLSQHPDIYMCPNREPNFFVADGQPDIPYRGPGDHAAFASMDMWVSSLDRYEQLFAGASGQKAIGEGTAWYIYFEDAARRIKQYLDNPKLIVVFRNPVDRAYSAYTMLLRDGRETMIDFGQALAAEAERRRQNWDPLYRYVDMGFYAKQLRHYYATFGRDRISPIVYDDFNSHPNSVVREVFRFLDVDEGFEPDTSTRHNVSMVPRNFAVHQLLTRDSPLKQALKSALPVHIRQHLKQRLLQRNLQRPVPPQAGIRAHLVEVFRADVLELQELIGRDLSGWLEPVPASSIQAQPQ